jgi:hypothetical protein
MAECEGCYGEGDRSVSDGTGGYERRTCSACGGSGDVCERCKSAPITDRDAGLCDGCTDNNAGRVTV